MKFVSKFLAATAAVLSLTSLSQAVVMSDIQTWVGTGSNQAALVIDFQDAKSLRTLVWGYRWDGAANGEQMFNAIVAADPFLFASTYRYDFGNSINGIGYDLDKDTVFGTSPVLPFDAGGLAVLSSPSTRATPTDSADRWVDGFLEGGYWEYFVSPAGNSPAFVYASAGFSDRVLVNGGWDAFSFAPGFTSQTLGEPVAAVIPEPAGAAGAVLSVAALLLLRRRKHEGHLPRGTASVKTALTTTVSSTVVATAASTLLAANVASGAVSVTVVDYTPGTQSSSGLDTAAYKATTPSKIQDFPRDTGGTATQRFATSLSNGSFANTTIIPVGKGGGLTLKFETPVTAVEGKKEFGLFVGNFLGTSGGLFYGDMRASILVSQDNLNWRTLSGQDAALNDLSTIYGLNTPSAGYQYTTGLQSWQYGTGGTRVPTATLEALGLADYTTQMPDDSIFNVAGAPNAPRAALVGSTDSTYSTLYGTSAGGNWFDISNTGFTSIEFIRLNVASTASVSLRLDSVFANALAVPEPTITLAMLPAFAILRRRR